VRGVGRCKYLLLLLLLLLLSQNITIGIALKSKIQHEYE